MEINYKKISMYYLLGNIFNKGIAFLTVPIFTRILSTHDYGIVNTYNSWVSMIAMILGMALHMGIRAAFIDYKEQVGNVLSAVVTFVLLSGSLFSVLTLCICNIIQVSNIVLVFLALAQGISVAILEDYSMYLMMQYRYKLRVLIMILPNLLAVIFSVVVILFVKSQNMYMGRIVPTALTIVAFCMLIVFAVYKKHGITCKREYLKYCLRISLPLIVHGISLNILSQSDRIMITWLSSSSDTAIYSLVYNLGMIATVITTALDGIWIPWFTEWLVEKRYEEINSVASDYIKFIMYALIGVVFVSPEIIKIMAPSEYWEGINIIPPIVLSNFIIFLYTLYVNVEHFCKKTVYISINTLVAACSNIVLNVVFVPRYGYVAAAYTTVASYLISLALHVIFAKKLQPNLFPLKKLLQPLLHILVATVAFYCLMDWMLIRWIGVIMYVLISIYIEQDRMKRYFPELPKVGKKNDRS